MLNSCTRLQGRFVLLSAAAMAVAQMGSSVFGASASWTGTTDGVWATTTNWTASPVPGSGNTATFNGAGGGNTTIDLGAGVTLGNVVFDTASAASYTIGSGAVGAQSISFGSNGGFVVNSSVVNPQLVNATVFLGADRSGAAYTFTNNSTAATLTFAGPILSPAAGGTPGGKALAIGGAGNFVISGVVSNGGASNTNITKSGLGTLTLTGANTYTGGTTINSGTLALDFSAAGAPAINILNNTSNSSLLTLASSNLIVTLSNSATANTQRFNGTTLTNGANAIRVTQNGNSNAGSAVTLAALSRGANATLDFLLPTTGTISTTSTTANVGTNKILAGATNGAAYATHNGTDWVTNPSGTLGVLSSYGVDTFVAAGDTDVQSNLSPAAFTVNTLRFNTATRTLTLNSSGASVVTSGGVLVTAAGTGSTIASGGAGAALTSGTTAKEVVVHNYGTLALDVPVTDNGANVVVLTHAGTGTTTLGAAMTNTGANIINSGTLKLGAAGALGSGAVTTRGYNTGALGTLDVNGKNLSLTGLLNNGAIANTGASATLTLGRTTSNSAGSFSGPLDLVLANTTATNSSNIGGSINTAGTITNSGSGSGSMTLTALIGTNVTSITQNSTTSQLTLAASTGTNLLTGPINILAGTLQANGNAGNNNPLGGGTIFLGNSTGTNPATLAFDQTGTVSNPISVVANATAGQLTIRATNTSGGVSHSGAITLNNNLTFDLPTTQNGGNSYSGGITGTGNLTFKLNSTAATGTGLSLTTGALNFTGSITNSGTGTRGASISSALGANVTSITQDAANSSLSLSANNSSFLGPITINAGTLSFSNTGASMGGGASAIQLGTAGSANATVGVAGNFTYVRALSVNAGDGLRTLTMSGNSQFDGAITLADDLRIQNTGGGVIQVRGGITGTGDLTLQTNSGNSGSTATVNTVGVNHVGRIINAGTVNAPTTIASSIGANVTSLRQESAVSPFVLSGNNSNFAGTVYVTTGLMTATTSNSLNNSAIVANVDGALRLDGAITSTIGGLDGSATGAVYGNPGAGTATLKLDGAGTYNFLGAISDDNNDAGAKVLTVNKTGSGTQALGGSSTYTGATTISGGKLLVNGSLAAGSNVAVNNTATLGGSGVVNGAVTLNTGGTIAPGNSVDDLTTGAQTWNAGVTYQWELNDAAGVAGGGAGPTAGWDLVNVGGALTINATNPSPVTIDITSLNGTVAGAAANFSDAADYQFLIADATSSIAFDPTVFSLSTANFANSFTGTWSIVRGDNPIVTGGGDDTQLYLAYAAVPEPATLSLLGLGAMGLLRRRRA